MTTQRIITSLVDYLAAMLPDVTVTAATNYEKIDLPLIAVRITSAEPHSIAVRGVLIVQLEAVLREHVGDDETGMQDQIEQLMNDPDLMAHILNKGVRVDHYQYSGSSEDWDEAARETTYSCDLLAVRV
jgi:hypothetical protein